MKRIWIGMVLVSAAAFAETCIVSGSTARTVAASGTAQTAVAVEAAASVVSAPAASASAFDSHTGSEAVSAELITLDTRKPVGFVLMIR